MCRWVHVAALGTKTLNNGLIVVQAQRFDDGERLSLGDRREQTARADWAAWHPRVHVPADVHRRRRVQRLPVWDGPRQQAPRGRRSRRGERSQGRRGPEQPPVPRRLERRLHGERRGERIRREQPEQLVHVRMWPELHPERGGSPRQVGSTRPRAYALRTRMAYLRSTP